MSAAYSHPIPSLSTTCSFSFQLTLLVTSSLQSLPSQRRRTRTNPSFRAIASVIFKIYEPSHSVLDGPHPGPSVGHKPITNSTTTTTTSSSTSTAALALKHAWAHATIIPEHLVKRNDEKNDDSSPDSLGVIFWYVLPFVRMKEIGVLIGWVCAALVESVLSLRPY